MKKDWNGYAEYWLSHRDEIEIEAEEVSENNETYLRYLGDEWGDKPSIDQFVRDFLVWPGIASASVLEIGSGGGRIAARVAPLCRELTCCDLPGPLLELCKSALAEFDNVRYRPLVEGMPQIPVDDESIDLIYSFDTLIHLDQRTIFRYFRESSRCLKSGGRAALHLASQETPSGFAHFIRSVDVGVCAGDFGSFEYVDCRAVHAMAEAAGFRSIATSLGRSGNFYYERDVIYLLEKR